MHACGSTYYEELLASSLQEGYTTVAGTLPLKNNSYVELLKSVGQYTKIILQTRKLYYSVLKDTFSIFNISNLVHGQCGLTH